MKTQKPIIALIPVIICYLISINKPFFWDTTHLASAQAQWFYQQGFNTILVPDAIDSGHPPLTGWLLAGFWKVFGKGLLQSHLFILPFLITALWQMLLVLKHYFPTEYAILALLFFLNPILLTQAMLVSPDILLFAGFFITLHGILTKTNWKILVGSLLLSMVSMRGMVCVASLAAFGIIMSGAYKNGFRSIITYLLPFIPSAITGSAFLIFHYLAKGWLGYHIGSPWAPSFIGAGLAGFFRNLVVLVWRFMDQGMIFIWLFPIWIFIKNRGMMSPRTKELLTLFGILFLFLVLPQLFYKYLLMHRYLYPCIAILTLASFSIVTEFGKIKNYLVVTSILMVSGFLWIYPDPISKGWDIMPLHYSYYSHRAHMLDAMRSKGIDRRQTGAAFPYEMPSSVIDLNNDDTPYAELNLETNQYILYSNISNDFSGETIHTLRSSWIPIDSSGTWPVYFILYKRATAP